MLRLEPGEKIVASYRPSLNAFDSRPGHCCEEAGCGRVPFRIMLVQCGEDRRWVALCGLHFLDAIWSCPELASHSKPRVRCSGAHDLPSRQLNMGDNDEPENRIGADSQRCNVQQVTCGQCQATYWVTFQTGISPSLAKTERDRAMSEILELLAARVTAEHNSGHCNEKLSISRPLAGTNSRLIAAARAI